MLVSLTYTWLFFNSECDIPVPIANQSLLTVSGSFGSRCFKDGDEIIQYFHYDKVSHLLINVALQIKAALFNVYLENHPSDI